LLPHRFTLACAGSRPPSAVCSLLHFPSGRPDWPLASTLPCGAPTFLATVPVRGRTPGAATRPTHRPEQFARSGTDRPTKHGSKEPLTTIPLDRVTSWTRRPS